MEACWNGGRWFGGRRGCGCHSNSDGAVGEGAAVATVPYTTVHGAPVLRGAELLLFEPTWFQRTAGSLGFISTLLYLCIFKGAALACRTAACSPAPEDAEPVAVVGAPGVRRGRVRLGWVGTRCCRERAATAGGSRHCRARRGNERF